MDKKKWLRRITIIGGSAAAAVAATVGAYFLWEKPPETVTGNPVLTEVNPPQPSAEAPSSPTAAPTPTPDRGTAFETERQDGVYTILLAGSDDGTGNTDTIMVAPYGTPQAS